MSTSSGRLDLTFGSGMGPDRGLYPISVVTELTGLEPHVLRGYERAGLLDPARTEGGSRRYSDNDVVRLRHISMLSQERVNLAGIRRILELERQVVALQAELAQLRRPTEGVPSATRSKQVGRSERRPL